MCGVAGAVGRLDHEMVNAVEAMNAAQAHRGPDDGGIWTSPRMARGHACTLGHRRLSIIDLSQLGHQPMIDPETGCAISYNGEVYNFQEIRSELIAAGHSFISECDTEVVLRAWVMWGEESLQKLHGMFAFAVWDPRRESLFLVRDRLGIKPLYYADTRRAGRGFFFASEVRAILATGAVERRMDAIGVGSYIRNGFVVGPNTIIEGIRLLPAGSVMRVGSDGGIEQIRRFWSPPNGETSLSEDEAVERVRERLKGAVAERLIADVPVGIFLSGGVDSSAIAALAQSASVSPVSTFNISFEEARYDESPFAESVARVLGTEHHSVKLTAGSFVEGLPAALASLDQPTFDAVNTYFVSRAVREAGLGVALAGTGGDELFGGYSSFRDLPRAHRVMERLRFLPVGLRRTLAEASLRILQGRSGPVPSQTRWGKLADVAASDGSLRDLYQISYSLFTDRFADQLTAGRSIDGLVAGLPAERARELSELISATRDLHGVCLLELSLFLGERLLRDTDVTSMAVSLEVRVPLVDYRLIEAVAAVPEKRRFGTIGRKALLRELGTQGIDPATFDRPKAGFELPIDVWCRQGLQSELADTLLDPTLCARVGLETRSVANLWRAFSDGTPGIYWSRIWALYVLMRWSREHDVGL